MKIHMFYSGKDKVSCKEMVYHPVPYTKYTDVLGFCKNTHKSNYDGLLIYLKYIYTTCVTALYATWA